MTPYTARLVIGRGMLRKLASKSGIPSRDIELFSKNRKRFGTVDCIKLTRALREIKSEQARGDGNE